MFRKPARRASAISSGAAVGIVPPCNQCQPYHDGKVNTVGSRQSTVGSRSRQAVVSCPSQSTVSVGSGGGGARTGDKELRRSKRRNQEKLSSELLTSC